MVILQGIRSCNGRARVEIVLLGTGTSIPHPEMASPGCCVRIPGAVLLFDIGSGNLKRLAEAGISYLDINCVFLTHFHPDHTGDLVPLLFAFRNPYHPRETGFKICGPPGLVDFYRGLCGAYGTHVEALDYDLEIKEMGGVYETDSFRVLSLHVPHTGASLAFRIESAGRNFVVSGDTGYSEELVEFSRGADAVLYECSFPGDSAVTGHLTPTLAARMAEEAGVGKLVLTHFYPVFDGYDITGECRKVFGGTIVLGRDLLTFQLD